MSKLFSQQLQQIVTLSEKMLLWLSNELERVHDDEDALNNKELNQWSVEREKLIKLTFNEQQSEHYSEHLPLINLMVDLENQLIKQFEIYKITIKTDLLKIKKNQKATKNYKKY